MPKEMTFETGESFALSLDRDDPLAPLRDRFHKDANTIYMLGNSLGLMSKSAERAALRILDEWRTLGIGGWLNGDPPWFYLAEKTGGMAAALVGAAPDEVICTGTTTFNIHSLVSTLYRPALGRTRILACTLDFPTDIYALKSQIALQGLDWHEHLRMIEGGNDGLISEDTVIDAMTEEVAIAQLPAVLYRSGQLLDIERLTAAAHERGIMIGFDCSHSVGVVPHHLDACDVDFAVWCGYKYLNGGPGAPAFLYLNRKYFACEPGLAGWFGNIKERQFDLSLDFEHAPSAGGWQVSSPGILGAATVAGALEVALEAGIERIRDKSLTMTSYVISLTRQLLAGDPYRFEILTPQEPERRGGHVALTRSSDALRIKEALGARGIIVDFRPPNVIRIAPSPLYSTYHELWLVVHHLRDIIDSSDHTSIPKKRKPIS
jgi:kynureninase